METVSIGFENMTAALKAKKLLKRDNITSRLIKADEELGRLGCMYALRVVNTDYLLVVSILRRVGINYNVIGGGI